MIGLSGLVDSLLSAKASPRMDVLAIKSELEIGAPGAVLQIPKVENDVRLPSNAALDRLIPAGQTGAAHADGVPRSLQLALSATARVISALLADLQGDAGPVRDSAPALPPGHAVSAVQIAGALAQTVSDSGLFYESHLVEFATGMRTLDAMRQEPQAQWSTRGPGQTAPASAAFTPSDLPTSVVGPDSVAPSVKIVADPAPIAGATRAATPGAHGEQPPRSAEQSPAAGVSVADATGLSDVSRLQAAYRWNEATVPPSGPPAPEREFADRVEQAGRQRHASVIAGASSGASLAPAETVIHPLAMTLVHQQLDLLATAVFRWTGDAFPGVSMDWSIYQENDEHEGRGAPEEGAPRPWSTTMALDLPRLGTVNLHLSLAGPIVHARLTAQEASTVARLRAEGGELSHRMQAAGLRLQELHVDAMGQP